MLFRSLEFLKEQLNKYLGTPTLNPSIQKATAKLENIGGIEDKDINALESIVITLVNLAEENTLKNTPNFTKEMTGTVYHNAPVSLNLYVLFTACFTKYDHALAHLSSVVSFFQGKNMFTHKNSVTAVNNFDHFKLILDLYSPTFEQVNYLWSTLGGRQRPFVLYKLRLLEIQRESVQEIRGIISEITVNEERI